MVGKQNLKQAIWLNNNVEVTSWLTELSRRSENTAKKRKYHLYHYFKWLAEKKQIHSAKQLLEEYEALRKDAKEFFHINHLKEYIFSDANKKKSYSWREGTLSSVRGFYRFNPQQTNQTTIKANFTQLTKSNFLILLIIFLSS